MDSLTSAKSILVWFIFIVYAISAIFIIPQAINLKSKTGSIDEINDKSLQFASQFILRIALIFPILLVIKNAI